MINQIKLNLKVTRWILFLAAVTVTVNVVSIFLHEIPVMWLINLLNIITIVNTLFLIQEAHRKYAVNESYQLYYTLPVKKTDILRADYLTNIIMIILSAIIFITWAFSTDYLVLSYGMVMIIGINLIMNSVYHWIFVNQWFSNITLKAVLFSLIPLLVVLSVHFMPLKNIFDRNLNLYGTVSFYFTQLPFVVLGIGLLSYAISYWIAKNKIKQTDIA